MARRWAWKGDSGGLTLVADVVQHGVVLTDAVLEKGQTITRVVGDISVGKITVSTATRRFAIAGLLTLPGAESVDLPNPLVDFDADWIWYVGGTSAPQNATADFGTRQFGVDNRSMRKVGDHELLAIVANFEGAGANLSWVLRVGLKLP